MKRSDLKNRQFIVLTLTDKGCLGFPYLEKSRVNKREIYFINTILPCGISKLFMLLGRFLGEFESDLREILPITRRNTNLIFFPSDEKIDSYSELTENEKKETYARLEALLKKYPEHAIFIRGLLKELR